ncbi:zinc finger MYM-type protein 1-like [Diorhabda carinulata]|uniref:zinc finger MYM-type protein 1-like n=1 Tax=Diorhabda carinulata TaxID=1163345 RepID=UPI00259FF013|nr:zinc finger MYM-type protein 1-like [Diorhabda carinulata]XP_057658707.1 zinc finger MYM-type protein 1-like [Diorhabda carinulata]
MEQKVVKEEIDINDDFVWSMDIKQETREEEPTTFQNVINESVLPLKQEIQPCAHEISACECNHRCQIGNFHKMTDISVQYLKTINFSSLSVEEKIKIKSIGRPKPGVLITNVTKCKSREYKRTFKTETYEKTDWLCGCDVSNSLYCFPCLLFGSDETSEWIKSGVRDLIHLSEKIKKHQNSKSHLSAKLEYNLLGKQDIRQQLNSAYRSSIQKHNDQVKNNRYVLSKIINCIKFCGAFELALRGHDEQEDSVNPGIFRGLINFSGELDLALRDHLQQATVFKGTAKDIQNDLLECMLSVCQAHIKKEIAESKFVSIMSDETSGISNVFQMVIIYRYTLPNGSPIERFWTFVKPNEYDAVALVNCIEEALNYVLRNPDQLISQSYDGASVMSGVQKLIKDKFKYAHYIHCYAHQLNLIMSQATSINMNARIFFAELTGITNFFSNSPEKVAILDEVVGNRASTSRWNFKIRTVVNIVYENRDSLILCLEKIQSISRQSDTITKAGALLRLLYDPKFIFWLSVFHRIIPHVNILYSQLQKEATDSVTVKKCITEFEQNIQKERCNLHTIETELVNIDGRQARKRKKPDEKHSYVTMVGQAKEVCDTIIAEIKQRFSFTGHLEIAHLFSVENFNTFSKNFPVIHLNSAIMNFPFLNKDKLKTELEIIYRTSDFREVSGAVHLLKFLIENNLQGDFSETFSVLQAIVTMPMTTAEAERCFSTLKRIKTFLRSTMGENRLTALAMLSIEKQMIQEIPNFNDLVIDKFILKRDRHIDFEFKTCL